LPYGCAIVSLGAVKIEAVNKVSTLRKLGVAARVASQQAGRSRTFSAVMSGVRTTGRSFGRAAHQLWLEVTGVIFLILALSFAGASVKEYEKYHAAGVGGGRMATAICFTVVFAWFGVSSFWRARRKSQRQ
jgi:hypothetical protein